MYLLINFLELWDILVLQKRKLRRTQPSTLARIVRAAGDQSQAPGLQMLCPANASLGWTRLFPNNSSDHFSTPSLQEVSAIDLISYFTWKNNHQMQTYSTSPIRQTLLFLKDSLHTQRGCPASPLYLSPFAPHKCSIGPRTLPFNLKQAHIAFILYGKHKTPCSTHFAPPVTTQTWSFPSQPYLKDVFVLPVFFLTSYPLLPSLCNGSG